MANGNGKGVKIAGGITFGSLVLAVTFYFTLTDRVSESAEAKTTVKMQVEAVEKRVDHLEEHESKVSNILDGSDGMVATVEVIKSELKSISKQGETILKKLDELSKK